MNPTQPALTRIKNRRRIAVAVALVIALLPAAWPDSLTLNNGERLTGDVVDLTDGVLTFRTTHGSRILIPADQIGQLRTDTPRIVKIAGGSLHTGALKMTDGQAQISTPDGRILATAPAADIESVTTPPDDRDAAGSPDRNRIGIESGVLWREARGSQVDLYTRLSLDRETELYTIRWETLLTADGTGDWPAYLRSEFLWLRLGDNKQGPFAAAGIERDVGAALAWRAYAAGGVARRFFESDTSQLLGGIGLELAHEALDASLLWGRDPIDELRWRFSTDAGLFSSTRQDETGLGLHLRLSYARTLFDRFYLQEELLFLPSLTDFGDWRAAAQSSIEYPLTDSLRLNLRLRIDYDDDTGFTAIDRWRTAVGAGLRFEF